MRKLSSLLVMLLVLSMVFVPAMAEEADPFGKYDPPITVHFVRDTDDTLDANFFSQYPDKTMTDNLWTDLYRDELGIIVEYDWIVKGGDEYDQKLNIALATGDIPEFVSLTALQVKQLAEGVMDGMISGLKEQGIVVADAQVLSAEHLSISGKDGIALSYSYYADYTGAGIDLNTTVYMAQFLVSEPALGTYNLTYTFGDPNDTDAALAILDSLKWN